MPGKKILTSLICAVVAFSTAIPSFAQAETYTLLLAVIQHGSSNEIQVLFGAKFPDRSILNPGDWLVQVIDPENSAQPSVAQVVSVSPDQTRSLVILKLKAPVDSITQRIVITYQRGNFPSIVLNQPIKAGASAAFTAAKGKDDADIYFSGTVAGAHGSKPLYQFESKIGYLKSFRFGSLGCKATANAAKESNIDPDSITATISYEKVFVLSPLTGIILQGDILGGEFDKESKTRNLTTGLDGILVIPPARFGEKTFASLDLLLGFEGGHNYKNELDPMGLGNFWRGKIGANVHIISRDLLGFTRVMFSTEYKVRILSALEPYTEKIGDRDVTTLTKKARHYIGADLDLMFSEALGISLKYRYGSLPPAFKFVNSSVSIGLTLQLKQANK